MSTPAPHAAPSRPVATRRRGEALLTAIHDATLEEIADVGFEAASIGSIAARAGAGKASIYKRWGTLDEITLAALAALDDPLTDVRRHYEQAPTVDVREALIDVLRRYTQGLVTPTGRALHVLMTQRERHPELYDRVHALTVEPRQRIMQLVLAKAASDGQIDASRVTPWVIAAGPRLLIAQHMERGEIREEDLTEVVDQILLPALGFVPRA